MDKQFGAKADKIYCGNCYDAQFASRCDGCGEVFRAGKLISFKYKLPNFFLNKMFSKRKQFFQEM